MRNIAEITRLLNDLDTTIADNLEDQDLDFKEWDTKSLPKALRTVIEMAICMANGGGGTVVFGVSDKILGRARAILGVPPEIDQNILMRQVYDSTDPKITPVFEELRCLKVPGESSLCKLIGVCHLIPIPADWEKSVSERNANL